MKCQFYDELLSVKTLKYDTAAHNIERTQLYKREMLSEPCPHASAIVHQLHIKAVSAPLHASGMKEGK